MNEVRRSLFWSLPLATVLSAIAGSAQLTAQDAEPVHLQLDSAIVDRLPDQARQAVENMHAQRRAQAVPTEMFSPYYSVAGHDETEVFLLNNIADPIRVQLAALSPKGEVLPLGEFAIGVTRHVSLSMRDAIRPAGREFLQGSLRLSFLGDADSVQAWTIIRRGSQIAEVGFEAPTESATQELVSFWSDTLPAQARAVFRVLNAGDRPLSYRISTSLPRSQRPSPRTLEPGQNHRLSFALEGPGFVRVQHDGEPGALKVAGLLEGRSYLDSLPMARREDGEQTLTYEIVRIPWNPQVVGSVRINLFNTADSERRSRVKVIDPATGRSLLSFIQLVAPSEVVNLDLGARLNASIGGNSSRELRLRVSAETPGLLISGKSLLAGGEVVELAVFKHQDAHASGSYPLLPLATHEVFSNITNLGDEPAKVVAQFYWEGGTYAFGPVLIEPGASYHIDVAEVAARKEADLLGRTLDPEYTQGFLKWSARGGSNALIARTEARPREGRDSFGFNCDNCCGEIPWGEVIPQSIDFFVGSSPTFESCYNISTCNATMGPFLTSPTSFNVPSPFSWNGRNVSSSSPGKETVSFSGSEQGAMEGGLCVYQNMPVAGTGKPSSCKTLLKKAHNPSQSWSKTQTCVAQVGSEPAAQKCPRCKACCNQILAFKVCSKEGLLTANNEHQACLTNCAIDICP